MVISTKRYGFCKTQKTLFVFLSSLLILFTTKTFADCATINASFTASQSIICGPGPVIISFTQTSTGTGAAAASYKWYMNNAQFGGQTTFAGAPPNSIIISTVGTYTFMMIATGLASCKDTALVNVYIRPLPAASFTFNPNTAQCVGTTISFTNTSAGTGSFTTYLWNFGDGTTSTATNPTHVYSSVATTVSLTMSNGGACTNSSSNPITVLPKPVQNFTATPSPGCATQTVTFTNTTTGEAPANNFYWDFGNGNTLNGVKVPPTQIYHKGNWTIMMVAGNACGLDTMYRSIEVDTIPKAVMTVSSSNGCTPLTVNTTNSSTGGNLNYQWYVDGVFTSTLQTINPVFTAPSCNTLSTHTVRLVAANHCGGGVHDTTVSIKVHPAVVAVVSPNTASICAELNFQFSYSQNSCGDSLSYLWAFGNGQSSTAAMPSAQAFINPGTYASTLTVTGFCGVNSASSTLTVYPIPNSPTGIGDTICSGDRATLTATLNSSSGNIQWFSVPTGGVYLSQGASYTTTNLTSNTTYWVQTENQGCKSVRVPVNVLVIPLPAAPTSLNATICQGTTATLTATAPGGIYEWYSTAISGVPLFTGSTYTTPILNVTTTYYVLAIVNGCYGPRKKDSVIVKPTPVLPTAASVSICSGANAILNATAPGGTYEWYDAPTAGTLLSTGATYIIPSLTTTTTYYVQTTVIGCVGPRKAVTVTVNPFPVADIAPDVNAGCVGLMVNFDNYSTAGGTYLWHFNGATPATSNQYIPPTKTFTSAGIKLIWITVTVFGCSTNDSTYVNIDPKPAPTFTTTPSSFSGCTPVTRAINNTSAVTTGDTYFWNLGNGTTSILQNPPSQTYTTTNVDKIFNIKLIITAANGCKDSITHAITVHPNPVALFSPNPDDTVCANTSLQFLNSSSPNGIATYLWRFGDGTTSTLTNPTHVYPTPNNYTVKLIATTSFTCKDSIQQLIVIDSLPVAAFTNTSACFGFATHFTNSSTGSIISRSWDFGDSSPLNSTVSPDHTYAATGTYNVTLTVTNVFGCSKSITRTVVVKPVPVAAFNAPAVCLGNATVFSNQTSAGPNSWMWDFGDLATSNIQNPTHMYSDSGTYSVTLIAFGASGCSDTIINPVKVHLTPIANFSFTSVCKNDTLFFNSTSLKSPDTYSWNFGNGFLDNANNPSPKFIYTISGTYNVILTAGYSSTGCTNSITIPVAIYPRTVPNFNSTTPCLNGPSGFTDITTNSPTQWLWNFGDGSGLSTTQNPTHTYANPSTYTISLVTQNSFGCRDSIIKITAVNSKPVAAFTYDTVCSSAPISFTDQSIAASSWIWNFDDGSPANTTKSPTHLFAANGTYNVKLIVGNSSGCTDSISHTVLVNPSPTAAFSASTACHTYPSIFNDSSLSAVRWSWNYSDGTTLDTLQSPTHIYANPGIYTVILTVTNLAGCTNSISHPVLINQAPVASFITTTPCLGDSTVFTDQSIGNPIGWTWDFNDSSQLSTVHNPKHAYTLAGLYNVKLIASGGNGCSDSITNIITVNPLPSTNFTSSSACTNDTMFFNNTSLGGPNTYTWNFGNGYFDNTNNPSPYYVYTAQGTYNVTLTAGFSATGCEKSITLPVIVFPITLPNFSSTTPCLNFATAFTDISANSPTKWNWNFGDGTAIDTLQNSTHTYAISATYNVTLVTENIFGCKDSIIKIAVVNPLPTAAFAFDTVCANTATSFTDQSLSAVSWNWNFGDGNPGNASNSPTHLFSSSGTYNVTLIVSNSFGCTDTVSHLITVNPNPISSYTPTIACHTYPTVFTDNSTGESTWAWDFGDATPVDSSESPTHIFANPGIYNVELIVKSVFGCSNSSSQIVTVLPQPQANYSVPNICARDTVQFTDNSVGAGSITWYWDFGDGTTATLENPNHVFQQSGNYNVSLIINNTNGCADTIVKPVIVNTVPSPFFSANAVCIGSPSTFTDLSTDLVAINSWFYDFDDGNTALTQSPNHIFLLGAGVYNVSLTVININGCDSSVVIPVNAYVVPVANFTVDTICIGTPTTFTDISSGNPSSLLWDFGDGTNDTIGPVASHVYATPGSFISSLTASCPGGCSDVTFRIVQVRSDVQVGIIATTSTCINEIVTMNDNSVIAVGIFLAATWDYGDGSPIVTALNTSHAYTIPGTYIISHMVVSDAGCSNTAYDTIVVNPYPVANFSTANTCQMQVGSFTDNSSCSPTSWNWDFGDGGTSALQNPTHFYIPANDFNVTLIITAAGCSDTTTNLVTVYPKPIASFTSNKVCWGDTTLFINNSTLSDGTISGTWWNFDDGTYSTSYNAEHILLTQIDSFNVTLGIVTSLGCVDTATNIVLTFPLNTFDFAPLPSSGCNEFTTTFNDSSTVTGGTIVNWLWNFGDGNVTNLLNPTHTYNSPGNYFASLTITSSYGCQMSDTLNYPVVVYPTPIAGFTMSPDQTTILEPEIQFNDGTFGANFWDFDFGDNETSIIQNPLHMYSDTGIFIITQIVTNQYGCRDTIQRPLRIDPITTAFIPNAFTPDGNTLNDIFNPKLFGVIEFNMSIFDRWGNEIFRTRDISEGWNGRFEGYGPIMKQDVYVYKIATKDIFLNNRKYVGRISLVR